MAKTRSSKSAKKKKIAVPAIVSWRESYDKRLADGTRLIAFVKQQLDAFSNRKDIALAFPTDGRVKELESIMEKCSRKDVILEKIDQFEDFVGIRVVCLFKKDITLLDEFIKESFTVISYEDTSERLADDSFGYRSNHYIVTLPKTWQTIPSMMGIDDLKIEVQVRTLSQHMWAAVSHKLQYKSESTVPYELRRSINRASAILELIDIEFDRVIRDRSNYTEAISNNANDDEDLNVDVVKQILKELLPQDNFERDERYDIVFSELLNLGVSKVGQLKELISDNLEAAKLVDKRQSEDDSLQDWTSSQLLSRGCYFNHMGLIREIMRQAFGRKKANKVIRASSDR